MLVNILSSGGRGLEVLLGKWGVIIFKQLLRL